MDWMKNLGTAANDRGCFDIALWLSVAKYFAQEFNEFSCLHATLTWWHLICTYKTSGAMALSQRRTHLPQNQQALPQCFSAPQVPCRGEWPGTVKSPCFCRTGIPCDFRTQYDPVSHHPNECRLPGRKQPETCRWRTHLMPNVRRQSQDSNFLRKSLKSIWCKDQHLWFINCCADCHLDKGRQRLASI